MWRDDNDKIEELFSNFLNIERFPAICPICKGDAAHIYMHIYDAQTKRGGMWVWCSNCHAFSHSTIYVPDYWKNCSSVEMDRLCAVPIYLENMRDTIDKHADIIRSSYVSTPSDSI